MPHSLLKYCQGACSLVDLDGSSMSESQTEEALQVAKKAALDWFGEDWEFSPCCGIEITYTNGELCCKD